MRVGIVGASGYSGGELLRYLLAHPLFEVDYIAAGSNAGNSITSLHPNLSSLHGKKFEATTLDRCNQVELLFLALPHGESASLVRDVNTEVKIVDLGADFRLGSKESWQRYYGGEHAGTWVYGLPEIPGNRQKISATTRIANPGCYATTIAIGTAPFVANGSIEAGDITVVAASGTTGAGRNAKINLLGSEVMGSLSSYKFGGVHQHTPEIEETLQGVARDVKQKVRISFTPILAPMPRGILATITARTTTLNVDELKHEFLEYFKEEPFIHLLEDSMPQTSSVVGSNHVHVAIAHDVHTSRMVLSVAIDNLGKGAAGQAIQNANLLAGFDETLGLMAAGLGK
ncbi:MAG: N-acetyl-gamma-glutamyl-phosphate reductase [Candidatus Nanopelagicaceae bacterium]